TTMKEFCFATVEFVCWLVCFPFLLAWELGCWCVRQLWRLAKLAALVLLLLSPLLVYWQLRTAHDLRVMDAKYNHEHFLQLERIRADQQKFNVDWQNRENQDVWVAKVVK